MRKEKFVSTFSNLFYILMSFWHINDKIVMLERYVWWNENPEETVEKKEYDERKMAPGGVLS
jgi:hypothetical protein